MKDNNKANKPSESKRDLRVLETEIEKTLQQIPTACLLVSSDGEIKFANPLCCKLFNSSESEFLKLNFLDFFTHSIPNFFDDIDNNSTDSDTASFTKQIIRRDGQQIYINIDVRKFDDSAYILLLKESIKTTIPKNDSPNLHHIIEKLQTPIVITDYSGKIEYANPYFHELTGHNKDDIVGKKMNILRTDYHSQTFYNDMWNTIKSGKTWEGDFFNQKKSKEKYWQRTVIYPIRNHEGEIIQFLSVVSDITEYKRIKNVILNAIIQSQETASDFVQLNAREIECLTQICKGLSNKELADKLFLSIKSIESIKSKLMEKTDVKNTSGLIIWAVKNRVIDF
ncbi:MAG: PAS domain-containing protein [Paludibacter sp.]